MDRRTRTQSSVCKNMPCGKSVCDAAGTSSGVQLRVAGEQG